MLWLVACTAPASNSTEPSADRPSASATEVVQPTATPEVSQPLGIIAMGHSGLTGEGTGEPSQPNLAASWATGTRPEVNSVYLRLLAIWPAMEGKFANTASGGAPASSLVGQTKAALRVVPAPVGGDHPDRGPGHRVRRLKRRGCRSESGGRPGGDHLGLAEHADPGGRPGGPSEHCISSRSSSRMTQVRRPT